MAEKDHCEQCGVQPGSQVVGDQPCKLRGDTSTMLAQRVLSLDMSGGGQWCLCACVKSAPGAKRILGGSRPMSPGIKVNNSFFVN